MKFELLASVIASILLMSIFSVSLTDFVFAEKKQKTDSDKNTPKNEKPKKSSEKKSSKSKDNIKLKPIKKTPSAATAIEVTVEMAKGTATNQRCANMCFVPNDVNLIIGDKVTWKNVDSMAHTATSITDSFDTNLVKPGKSASYTFNTVGEFQYICLIHPWMQGKISVFKQ